MKYLFFLLCFGFSILAIGQTDFRKGKIITLQGDTIFGELDWQGDITNSRAVRFRKDNADAVFKPFEIAGYRFDDGRFFVSKIAVNSKDTTALFAEYLVKGKKDLFFYRSATGFHYALTLTDSVILEIPYRTGTVNVDGVNYQNDSKQHVGFLKYYFSEFPSLFPEIERLKAPNRSALVSLTRQYHELSCDESNCVVFKRKKFPLGIAIEAVYSHYLKKDFIFSGSAGTAGAHLYFWLPNSSERLYVKTGILKMLNGDENYFQVPLQFEYRFPFKIIKPKFDAGVNLHFGEHGSNGLSLLAGVGCLVKITELVYLDLDVCSDLVYFEYKSDIFPTVAARAGLLVSLNSGKKR